MSRRSENIPVSSFILVEEYGNTFDPLLLVLQFEAPIDWGVFQNWLEGWEDVAEPNCEVPEAEPNDGAPKELLEPKEGVLPKSDVALGLLD